MNIVYEGQEYEITNWEEFQFKLLSAIAFQIESNIIQQINTLGLVDTGDFKKRLRVYVKDNEIIIENSAEYAVFLEYGTLQYYQNYKPDSFPTSPHKKKKNMKPEERKKYPKGGQPFAPIRRVLYNKAKLKQIIDKAVSVASK